MEGCECPETTGRHAQVSRMDNCNRLGRTEWGKRVNSSMQAYRREGGLQSRPFTGVGDVLTSAASMGV